MSEKNDKNNNNFKFDMGNRAALFLLAGLVLLFFFFVSFSRGDNAVEISYTQFMQELKSGNVNDVTILDMREIQGRRYDTQNRQVKFKTVIPYFDDNLLVALEQSGVTIKGGSKGVSIGSVLIQLLPVLLLFGFVFWMYRNMQGGGKGAMSFGKSKAKLYDSSGANTTFVDVAGQKEAKYELEEVVEFLKNPDKFTRLGAKLPKGVLLVGEPGTGKTLLAKAVAGEAGVPFFHMSGSDFVEMFVGVGASRVRDLFDQGRKNAPCIIFIDEIDAVGRTRGAGYGGGHDEREQTLNQLLVEMDGFDTDKGVIIIAATNRPDVLDPALLRPGRFDRQVVVAMPDVREREAILSIHAEKIIMDKDVKLSVVARATPGSSGADIANIVNEAALFAGREGRKGVKMADFEEARDKILMGVARRSLVMSEEDRRMTAYHEAGHALLHYEQERSDPIHKVTIIPRGRALGVTFSLPEKDQYSKGIGWIKAHLVILYGGFAAEELIFNETTTGAQNDIRQATDLARKMVCDWGMSNLGPVALGGADEPIFIGKEIAQHADYSDDTARLIDVEVRDILNTALESARSILKKEQKKLESLTKALIERETLNDADIRKLWGMGKPEIKKQETAL
ncbi:MAG: cell division protein FtsH [Spirochaetes bacterium]|nr:MAG: cell division protein FtsH [Spirochaetota bacterium]